MSVTNLKCFLFCFWLQSTRAGYFMKRPSCHTQKKKLGYINRNDSGSSKIIIFWGQSWITPAPEGVTHIAWWLGGGRGEWLGSEGVLCYHNLFSKNFSKIQSYYWHSNSYFSEHRMIVEERSKQHKAIHLHTAAHILHFGSEGTFTLHTHTCSTDEVLG